MNRRTFLATTSAGALSAVAPQRLPIKKAVLLDMLPSQLS
jgi:hypothetical protein